MTPKEVKKNQTIAIPVEINGIPVEINGKKSIVFIRKVTDEVSSTVIPYKYLTGGEHDKEMNNELNKKKDPCEKDWSINKIKK